MGGYDDARVVHFLGMSTIVAFLVVHLALVALVPSTLLPMFTGVAKVGGQMSSTGARGQP
jgi:thiosulfate reductase cytochrome b subunit